MLAPFALYPRLGALTAPLCGVLTVFYRGFLVLSKSFLDPFGNEVCTTAPVRPTEPVASTSKHQHQHTLCLLGEVPHTEA